MREYSCAICGAEPDEIHADWCSTDDTPLTDDDDDDYAVGDDNL